jgi:hypothetical protein
MRGRGYYTRSAKYSPGLKKHQSLGASYRYITLMEGGNRIIICLNMMNYIIWMGGVINLNVGINTSRVWL